MRRFTLTLLTLLTSFALLTPPALAVPSTQEINLDVGSPPVVVVKHSLTQRHSRLLRFYDAGAIGLGNDGMVKLRDTSRLNPTLLKIAEKLIDQENPERKALVVALAESNGGKENIAAVREAQIKRWREQFKSGWWIEDDKGQWTQKP